MRADHRHLKSLLEFSRVSPQLSARNCRGSFSGSDTCEWYHGAWPLLRYLDCVSTPFWHYDFYNSILRHAAARLTSQVCRVAIFGCADFSTLAVVRDALGNSCSIQVIDRCRTALLSNIWFADRFGFNISTLQFDFLIDDKSGLEPADIVISDALLTRFTPGQRPIVFTKLQSMLRKGGYFVSTVRDHAIRSSEEWCEEDLQRAFVKRVIGSAESAAAPISKENVEPAAIRYIRNMRSFGFESDSELRSLIQDVGLTPLLIEKAIVPGELQETMYNRVYYEAGPL